MAVIYPSESIAEILGRPAQPGFDPSSKNYQCPFINDECKKRSTSFDHPYPVCTIKRKGRPICVCPKRFYEINFLEDVIAHAWPGDKPKNPQIAREVTMEGFGNVDFVIADTTDGENIQQFLSVELQAIDITGTVRDAYEALTGGVNDKIKKKSYGLNWKNVYKRYIHQLISKGYYHHHWGTKIVAVIQNEIYNYICDDADFMRSKDIDSPNINIIFMSYKMTENQSGEFDWVLDKVEGTHHSNLQTAVLYKSAPSRSEFCKKVSAALRR